jgi:hypothetical protein
LYLSRNKCKKNYIKLCAKSEEQPIRGIPILANPSLLLPRHIRHILLSSKFVPAGKNKSQVFEQKSSAFVAENMSFPEIACSPTPPTQFNEFGNKNLSVKKNKLFAKQKQTKKKHFPSLRNRPTPPLFSSCLTRMKQLPRA